MNEILTRTATIVLPDGYATAEEFAEDCGFVLLASLTPAGCSDQTTITLGMMIEDNRRLQAELEQARLLVEGSAWRTDFENAPSEAYEFFLVRPRCLHPAKGKPFHPTIVQRIDGEFYTSDNELEPIYFGQNEDDDHPLKTTLEWKPLPADWLSLTSTAQTPEVKHEQ
ncbi:hypothetical protein [Bradyrhizobium sp. SEMIA]|uniref:hypothetical protein n=1 Tax=Bradyrhizobium sp. SEMIA TaxID=2597515 RepID=UPI0018A4DC83|nr:hypothetical protein [Bradyrhizobium sp. SEMIA]QOG20435.1 hypothetical protein FOM02_26880 [Bradyrhizobium sp. SEMIA]